ncbi:MAG TPA: hypothetical protein VG819_15035 [Rhizomicrobium sp.]|jgi:hypothetical protein|nr:hypothetical protein [Rhizomicrobium sp.]
MLLMTEVSSPDCRMACEGRPLSECMERKFHPEIWADVLEALLSGRLRIVANLDKSKIDLSKIFVRPHEFSAFENSVPVRIIPEGIAVPCLVAGALLGVSGATVGCAVRQKLLNGTYPKKYLCEISLRELEAFSQEYLLGGEGDLRLGRSRAFSNLMKAAGYQQVAVIRRNLVWKRVDGEEFLKTHQLRKPRRGARSSSQPKRFSVSSLLLQVPPEDHVLPSASAVSLPSCAVVAPP